MPMIVERHRTISEASFRDSFLVGRQPVILTGAIDAWPARRRWSLDFFRGLFGERMVTFRCSHHAFRLAYFFHSLSSSFFHFPSPISEYLPLVYFFVILFIFFF